jgi:transposase
MQWKTAQQQRVEFRFGEPISSLLRRLYVDEGLNQAAIAEHLGVSARSVQRWMDDFDIPRGYNRRTAA